MKEKRLEFPQGFLWGAATSAYQVEGGLENSDWSKAFPAGRAADHWNKWREDFDLFLKLNLKAYRMSVEWSRIEPREGEFDQQALNQYREMLEYLKNQGVKTFLTLHHFTTPKWLSEKSGWENKAVISYFSRFAERVFKSTFDLVDFWQTMNEPLGYAAISYLDGRWPPKKKNFFSFLKVFKNQILAHRAIYILFHRLEKDARVGVAEKIAFMEPAVRFNLLDKLSAGLADYFWNRFFLNRIRRHLDFIGLNYYFHNKIAFPYRIKNDNKKVSDIGWEIYSEGIYHALKRLKRYNLPIYITENGLADQKDKFRAQFIKDHLYWVWRSLQEEVDVRGYLHWSLLDNFEWDKGFGPRFGLVEVDYNNFSRKIRPSAYFYSQIAKTNTLYL